MIRPDKNDAIRNLVSGVAWSTTNGEIKNWDLNNEGISRPTDEEINTELTRLQAVYDAQDYARNRKAEYDQLNQFEMQFDDDRDSTTTWVDKINEIKGRHPK